MQLTTRRLNLVGVSFIISVAAGINTGGSVTATNLRRHREGGTPENVVPRAPLPKDFNPVLLVRVFVYRRYNRVCSCSYSCVHCML